MLRAALIGFPSSGKTTLFQLMTSAKDAPRGKGDVNIGISKVPDARLDVLTRMYNPRKRVPATVEFTDLVAQARTGSGAQALVDVAAYKNADALVHVIRAFRDAAVPHPSGSVDPARDAQAMEDELILADLGVVERRLERIDKDLKKTRTTDLEKERDLVQRCKDALEAGTPLRALELTGDDLKRLRGFQLLTAKPLLLVINLDENDLADVGADVEKAARKTGLTNFLAHAATRAVAVCAKIELEIAQL
jgi:ribosome-binding ATPase YchF (GTP1/OBG family)